MTHDRISTRVELDREVDLEVRKLARDQTRSKRQLLAVVTKGVVRVWRENPDALKALRIIQ
jgi:hypothetical protein